MEKNKTILRCFVNNNDKVIKTVCNNYEKWRNFNKKYIKLFV